MPSRHGRSPAIAASLSSFRDAENAPVAVITMMWLGWSATG
jgi:hypothetical protein